MAKKKAARKTAKPAPKNRADINVINSDTVLEGTGIGFGGGASGDGGSGTLVTERIAWREVID